MTKNKSKRSKKEKIFVSWSGEYSKQIANDLKHTIERVFKKQIICFVSSVDIASGEDWYKKIKRELNSSSMGILVITKENIKAPWLYFEAGALISKELRVIPLLVNCDQKSLENTPISANQSVQFYYCEGFKKMLEDIRIKFRLFSDMDQAHMDPLYEEVYLLLKKKLEPILNELKTKRYYSERYIFPQSINTMTMKTVYISAPMSTLGSKEYKAQQQFLKELSKELIEKIGFNDVFCPAINVSSSKWQGITTAISDNFTQLRQTEHLIVIYPKAAPTSILIEVGYGIALCKNTVIFYKNKLPYMLDGAEQDIPHLHIRRYNDYSEIKNAIITDKNLFEVKRDD